MALVEVEAPADGMSAGSDVHTALDVGANTELAHDDTVAAVAHDTVAALDTEVRTVLDKVLERAVLVLAAPLLTATATSFFPVPAPRFAPFRSFLHLELRLVLGRRLVASRTTLHFARRRSPFACCDDLPRWQLKAH